VFKNIVLRNTFGPKGDEITGDWIIMHNKELCELYSSPYIILVMELKIMRCTEHVECMGENRCIHGFGGDIWGKETIWKT
jgi:hypothetical protein